MIKFENITHTYLPGTPFEHTALKSVTLEIKQGEFIGLIGHTGSGKTTLIQLLAGLVAVQSGKVYIGGEDISLKSYDRKKLRAMLGVVFQYPEYQLFEETVEKDISYGPAKIGQVDVAGRVKNAMKLVGLEYEKFAHKSPFELSGGQKRKVAIAGVLAMTPQILVLDEPIAGLDPQGRDEFMELISRLNKEGTTIIMISHVMDGLAEYASRIIAMKKGEVALDGTPRDVFTSYDAMKKAGMAQPAVASLSHLLRKSMEFPYVIKEDELVEALVERCNK